MCVCLQKLCVWGILSQTQTIVFGKKKNSFSPLSDIHGDFREIKDIQKIKPISPEIFRKIAPYLKTSD